MYIWFWIMYRLLRNAQMRRGIFFIYTLQNLYVFTFKSIYFRIKQVRLLMSLITNQKGNRIVASIYVTNM